MSWLETGEAFREPCCEYFGGRKFLMPLRVSVVPLSRPEVRLGGLLGKDAQFLISVNCT